MAAEVATRFGTYEAFRILLPGFFAIGIAVLEIRLFFPNTAAFLYSDPVFSVFVILGGILFGLALYDYDYPVHRTFWKEKATPNQPSKFLLDWCKTHASQLGSAKVKVETEGQAIQLYFILLNGYMEP